METALAMDLEHKTREAIRNYIAKSASVDVNSLDDNLHIFEQGLLDSMGLLFLIDYIKEKFNVEVEDNELVVENFVSINSIVAFVFKRLKD